jgi:hypothetical protein
MALLPTWFLDAVVAIGAVDPKGNKSFFASGFFYGVKTDEPVAEGQPGKYKLFLVTPSPSVALARSSLPF